MLKIFTLNLREALKIDKLEEFIQGHGECIGDEKKFYLILDSMIGVSEKEETEEKIMLKIFGEPTSKYFREKDIKPVWITIPYSHLEEATTNSEEYFSQKKYREVVINPSDPLMKVCISDKGNLYYVMVSIPLKNLATVDLMEKELE